MRARAHSPRSSRGRSAAGLLVAPLAVLALVAGPAAAAPPGPDGTAATGGSGGGVTGSGGGADFAQTRHTVTLITGDVVTLTRLADGTQTVAVEQVDPTAVVRTYVADGEMHVIPASAAPYLAAGVLDDALFNVSRLVEYGFDDDSRDGTPVIVQYSDAPRPFATTVGLGLDQPLESIDGAAGEAPHAIAEHAWAALTATNTRSVGTPQFTGGIAAIHLDAPVHALLDTSVPWIGAPQVWEAGYDGAGITVAVLDTGIDAAHPDLVDVVGETRSFVPDEGVEDYNGHGTHVASTVAGSGAASGGSNRGVAPGADLVIGKVLNNDGDGLTSWIIEGMEWGAANADLVSMSLGSIEPSDGTDVMSLALDTISRETGKLFVVAAGNASAPGTIGAPGAATEALTIGSVDDPDGGLSWFSSQGPLTGSGALKPDLAAPGNDIYAARSAFSPGEGDYVGMGGTSMATPHVAGAAALALQADPDLTAAELKGLLASSARDVALGSYQVGTGALDAAAVITREVFASGSGDFGMLAWGEGDGSGNLVERPITFTNRSEADITLDLEVVTSISTDGDGGGGEPMPLSEGENPAGTRAEEPGEASSAVVLEDPQVLVPAGGTATVVLTGDHDALAPGSQLTGTLIGTVDGAVVTRTALGMVVEAERYDLVLTARGLDGAPTSTEAMIFDLDTQNSWMAPVDDTATLRLPAGRYSAMAFLEETDAAGRDTVSLVGTPVLTLDADTEVALDASATDPVTVDVGRADLSAEYRRMDYQVESMMGSAQIPAGIDELRAQPLTSEDSFSFTTRWRLRDPRITLELLGQDLAPAVQSGAPLPDGDLSGTATDLGTGSAAETDGLQLDGGIAVVRASDTVTPNERVMNAAAAGAGLLVVVYDEASPEWYGDDLGAQAAIPVVAVSGASGEDLLAALAGGTVELTAIGRAAPVDLYDLLLYTRGEIPANPTKTAEDLALVTTSYIGTEPAEIGEFRYDFAPGVSWGQGFPLLTQRPAVVREWISTTDAEWHQMVLDPSESWEVRDVRRSYDAGAELTENYFGAVVRPYIGPGYWAPFREGQGMQANVPGWADGSSPQRTGALDTWSGIPGFSQRLLLQVDGETVVDTNEQSMWYSELPAESARLVLTTETEQDGTLSPTTLASTTSWAFDSAWTDQEQVLPLMQAYYDVDVALDGSVGGDRAAGTGIPLGLQVSHLAGAAGIAPISQVVLSYSTDDGGTWLPLDLTEQVVPSTRIEFVTERAYVRTFETEVPVADAGDDVSLRVELTDEAGSTMFQEVSRAFVAAPAEETVEPTEPPTVEPTEPPTVEPTEPPTTEPTDPPTTEPTDPPTTEPTDAPTATDTSGPQAGEKPGSTPGGMASTGASVGLLAVLALLAAGAGVALRRRAQAR